MAPPDAGSPLVDAGPERFVDGGLVGPFARGEVIVTQTAREVGARTVFTSRLSARFVEVAAPTPSPCVERAEPPCVLRICNLSGSVAASPRSAGEVTIWGLLPLERDAGRSDGGLDGGGDAGSNDGGPGDDGGLDGGWPLERVDGGVRTTTVSQRVFFSSTELFVTATGDEVPAFTTPAVLAPAQLTLASPRCVPTCPAVPRDAPFDVRWTGVGFGEVVVQLTTPQVTITCSRQATDGPLSIPTSLLAELTPSTSSGEATLLVKTRSSVQVDAGGFEVSFSAETPELFPITVLP